MSGEQVGGVEIQQRKKRLEITCLILQMKIAEA